MSSPGETGPRDVRRDPSDATVTASMPAISAERLDAADTDASPYPHGGMPGAASRDDWKGPDRGPGGSGGGPSARTEVVPNVAPGPRQGPGQGPVPAAGRPSGQAPAGAGRPESGGRLPFGGSLPPRPGEANGRAAAGAAAAGAAAGTATTTGKRPLRSRVSGAPKPARRAQLTLRRFNVWSVFKFSCMLAIALWLVWMIAIGVLYGILDASGVVASINDAVAQVQGADSTPIIRPGQVLGIAAIVGVVNIVLFIALASLFSVIYNLVSDFVGGVEVTLSERE